GYETHWANPATRLLNMPSTTVIGATWEHSGSLATDRIQFRLLSGTGALVSNGTEITAAVAANASVGRWTNLAGIANLVPGQTYRVQMRGRDTTGLWSEWVSGPNFTVNAAPGVPTGLS